jgi:hypothetical protein
MQLPAADGRCPYALARLELAHEVDQNEDKEVYDKWHSRLKVCSHYVEGEVT